MRNTFLCITFVLFDLTLIDIKQLSLHLVLFFNEFTYRSSTHEIRTSDNLKDLELCTETKDRWKYKHNGYSYFTN